jgi:hypothetical protein
MYFDFILIVIHSHWQHQNAEDNIKYKGEGGETMRRK